MQSLLSTRRSVLDRTVKCQLLQLVCVASTRLHTLRCRVNFASGVHADFADADDRLAVLGFADVGCAWRSLLVQMRDQFIIGPVVPLGDSKYDRALSIHCRQQMHEFFVV